MIIRSAPVLAILLEKKRRRTHDRSEHLLCPVCRVRTKLYALKDGRRKCSVCGKKFDPAKKTDRAKLAQYAELLLCFCMNFTARQASEMTGYHYRLASSVYDRFRTLLAAQTLTPGKMALLRATAVCDRSIHDSVFCERCKNKFHCKGRKSGDSPIFGVKILADNRVFVDPLSDDEANARFDRSSVDGQKTFSGYAGFVCRGKFHRFADNERTKDGAEQLWAWMSERLKQHHGIWKKNAGLYLKELEWKYNNRQLPAEAQATHIAELLPEDFLTIRKERIEMDMTGGPVQNRA